jgi:ribosomal protein S18 acetylase RimI-like enzyme
MDLLFASKAPNQCRPALEDLLFFNPRQYRVRDGIVDSLAQFGHPRLEQSEDGLRVCVGEQETQTLFAFDRDTKDVDPVGVVVFLRTSPEQIAILHVAVRPDYSLRGRHRGLGLGTVLVDKVKEIARRIVGVERIVLYYQREIVIKC